MNRLAARRTLPWQLRSVRALHSAVDERLDAACSAASLVA